MGSIAAHLVYRQPDERRLERMLRAAPHRGQDFDLIQIGSVELGISNRVELADASLAATERLACAFVGRLDNQPSLSSELGRPSVRSELPAETLLVAFGKWGDRVWERLRGDFAVVVTDGTQLWSARDHLGSSTLFFRIDSTGVYVASEAKQVIAGAGISREPNFDLLHRALFGEEDAFDEPTVMIRGVERVPRASVTTYVPGSAPRSRRYWDPTPLVGTARLTPSEAQEQLIMLLEQAAERTITGSDVVALSGGIDSPVVAAFAAPAYRELTGRPLPALSTIYPHAPSVDESPYIEAVVQEVGLDGHTFVPGYRQLGDMAMWVDLLDGPMPTVDVSAMAEFFQEAAKLGARTVLMGELAELVYDLQQHVTGDLIMHGRWPTAWRHMGALHQKGRSWSTVLRSVLPSLAPSSIATSYVRLRARDATAVMSWIDPGMVPGLNRNWVLEIPARQRFSEIQRFFAMAPSATGIEASNMCAAYFGMHLRRPLIDLDLWEFFLSLPTQIKFPNAERKSIVRAAARGRVPDLILDRQDKTGFTEDVMGRVDYEEIRRWIFDTDFHLKGIDYPALAERLEQRDANYQELIALNRLASIHAFVSLS